VLGIARLLPPAPVALVLQTIALENTIRRFVMVHLCKGTLQAKKGLLRMLRYWGWRFEKEVLVLEPALYRWFAYPSMRWSRELENHIAVAGVVRAVWA